MKKIPKEVVFRKFLDIIREELIKNEVIYETELQRLGVGSSTLAKFILEMREDGARLQVKKPYSLKDLEVLGLYGSRSIDEEKKDRGMRKVDLIQCQKICEEVIKFDNENLWSFALGFTLGRMGVDRIENEVIKGHDSIKNSLAGQHKRKPRTPKKIKVFLESVYMEARVKPKSVQSFLKLLDNRHLSEDFTDFSIEETTIAYYEGKLKKTMSVETLRKHLRSFQSNPTLTK